MKCLVVDDVEDNLLVMEQLLAGQDIEILFARSGREALELLLEHDVALALVDVQMPEMDGFELAELMRGSLRTRHVPIIFVTAGSRDQHRVFQGYELGAVDFLFKPIEAHVLRSKTSVFTELYRQRQQLARELEERTEALRTNEMFMAMLSHDLRNPLGAMLAGAELLSRRSSDPGVLKTADRIRSSGVRMTGMIEQMLDWARVRLGQGLSLELEPLDLGELVRRVVAEHQTQAGPGRIEILECGDAKGNWDKGRLGQVVSNLVGNALTHGASSEPVRVRIDGGDGQKVVLSVSNAGGIPEASRAQLFDPFRGREGRRSADGGLGLGLYIVQQVVHAHGGSVQAVTPDPDHTAFMVELPRAASQSSTSRAQSLGQS